MDRLADDMDGATPSSIASELLSLIRSRQGSKPPPSALAFGAHTDTWQAVGYQGPSSQTQSLHGAQPLHATRSQNETQPVQANQSRHEAFPDTFRATNDAGPAVTTHQAGPSLAGHQAGASFHAHRASAGSGSGTMLYDSQDPQMPPELAKQFPVDSVDPLAVDLFESGAWDPTGLEELAGDALMEAGLYDPLVPDPFLGSGTALPAAHGTGVLEPNMGLDKGATRVEGPLEREGGGERTSSWATAGIRPGTGWRLQASASEIAQILQEMDAYLTSDLAANVPGADAFDWSVPRDTMLEDKRARGRAAVGPGGPLAEPIREMGQSVGPTSQRMLASDASLLRLLADDAGGLVQSLQPGTPPQPPVSLQTWAGAPGRGPQVYSGHRGQPAASAAPPLGSARAAVLQSLPAQLSSRSIATAMELRNAPFGDPGELLGSGAALRGSGLQRPGPQPEQVMKGLRSGAPGARHAQVGRAIAVPLDRYGQPVLGNMEPLSSDLATQPGWAPQRSSQLLNVKSSSANMVGTYAGPTLPGYALREGAVVQPSVSSDSGTSEKSQSPSTSGGEGSLGTPYHGSATDFAALLQVSRLTTTGAGDAALLAEGLDALAAPVPHPGAYGRAAQPLPGRVAAVSPPMPPSGVAGLRHSVSLSPPVPPLGVPGSGQSASASGFSHEAGLTPGTRAPGGGMSMEGSRASIAGVPSARGAHGTLPAGSSAALGALQRDGDSMSELGGHPMQLPADAALAHGLRATPGGMPPSSVLPSSGHVQLAEGRSDAPTGPPARGSAAQRGQEEPSLEGGRFADWGGEPIRPVTTLMEQLLMQCAIAVERGELDEAQALMAAVFPMVSARGTAQQRIGFYFLEGLAARILGTGSAIYKELQSKQGKKHGLDSKAVLAAALVFFEACPWVHFGHYVANGTILEAVEGSAEVHIIDFGLTHGTQFPTLIEQLALRPSGPPHLRITGIEAPQTGLKPSGVQETGRRLASFARVMGVPFEFRPVMEHPEKLTPDTFEIRPSETLIVNCMLRLHQLPDDSGSAGEPSPLACMLQTVRRLKPKIMTLVEQSVDHNSTSFVVRFREALHYMAGHFEAMDMALPWNSTDRALVEERVFGRKIINLVACEGEERVERHQANHKWVERLQQQGFVPRSISDDVIDNIQMLLKKYPGSYGIRQEGQSLLLTWKGNDYFSASIWGCES